MSFVRNILGGFATLLTGLGITVKEMFKRPVTYKYPHEDTPLSPNYRSAIKLIRFDETNSHDCVACLACQRICPSFCISIEGGKVEGIKKKRATKFHMDFALCSLCGLCIDACPTDTLEYSKLYDKAGYNRDWNMDLLEDFREFEPQFIEEQREREEKEAEEKKKKAAAAKAAKAAKAKKAAEAKPAKAKPAEAKEAAEAKPAAAKKALEKKAADKTEKKAADKTENPAADKGATNTEKPATDKDAKSTEKPAADKDATNTEKPAASKKPAEKSDKEETA